ncbi:MAG: ferredoxin [Salinivirgaceae bacterium]|nr:MAG: ferredoxin [Salinivirgaceae bacterium]
MKKIILHRDKCIGCSICVDLAPDFFTMHVSDGKAFIINEPDATIQKGTYPFMDDMALAEMAQKCPVNAIVIK